MVQFLLVCRFTGGRFSRKLCCTKLTLPTFLLSAPYLLQFPFSPSLSSLDRGFTTALHQSDEVGTAWKSQQKWKSRHDLRFRRRARTVKLIRERTKESRAIAFAKKVRKTK